MTESLAKTGTVVPVNERQVRPLTPLDPPEQIDIHRCWTLTELAPLCGMSASSLSRLKLPLLEGKKISLYDLRLVLRIRRLKIEKARPIPISKTEQALTELLARRAAREQKRENKRRLS